MPSNNSALVALTESKDEGDLQCSPGIAMVASKHSVGTDLTNLNDCKISYILLLVDIQYMHSIYIFVLYNIIMCYYFLFN